MMKLPRIAITMGDPAGVGPELCYKVLNYGTVYDRCKPIIFGDAELIQRSIELFNGIGPTYPVVPYDHDLWTRPALQDDQPVIVHMPEIPAHAVAAGKPSAATGYASHTYVVRAIDAALAGQVDAVVTAPIQKEAWHAAGINYPGHTELFAERTGCGKSCMMLTSEEITCSFVTTHVGLRDVPGLLTVEQIRTTIELSAAAMRQLRGRAARIAVCALNPHAGEHGLFGDGEEERLIAPAIASAQELGINVVGPLSADTAFLPAKRAQIDCFVCMYHDQGLIPLKTLAFDEAVNITLGLPIIRTSVDHGTACDIAWQGKAKTDSLVQAILLAVRLAKGRRRSGSAK